MTAYLQGISKLNKLQRHRIAQFATKAVKCKRAYPKVAEKHKGRISGYLRALWDIGVLKEGEFVAVRDRVFGFIRGR